MELNKLNFKKKLVSLNKTWVLLFIFLIIFILLALFFTLKKNQQKPQPKKVVELVDYKTDQFGISFQYPKGFIEGQINPEDQKKDPLIVKLVRTEPPTLILVNKEELAVITNLVKQPLFEYLKGNIDRKYSVVYSDYQKEKVEEEEIAQQKAFTVLFNFQDPEKKYRETMRISVIVKDNDAYYLSCMAPVETWSKAETACNQIKDNFQFTETKNTP